MRLEEFLVEAKQNTYASGSEGGARKLEDDSKEYVYEEGEWKYCDRYFGFDFFIGEEIVWRSGTPIWGMNYYGGVLGTAVASRAVYEFLEEALRNVKIERPFRGPSEFTEGDFVYTDKTNGTPDLFEGLEVISYRGAKVYELRYHGGTIKNKDV